MSGVTATIGLTAHARLTGTPIGGDTPMYEANLDRYLDFAAGTDAIDKTDLLYRATRTLAASANEDLDLAGVLVSPLGTVIGAAEVVALIIEAAAGNANAVRYGPSAANGALLGFGDVTDRRVVLAGDFEALLCRTGWPIVAGTGDKINIANGGAGTSVTYTITVLGRSVAA